MTTKLGKPFWVVWAIELWERFGYYGVQAIITLYFVQHLGYSENHSFYVFGSFSAFVYGFIWIGGWVGDKYLGTKATLALGAIILMFSYVSLAVSNANIIFYSLAGIVVGNALFKANPSSLISKMFQNDDAAFDGAITIYYMAINVGSMLSMALTPIVAERFGWDKAFWICAAGLLIGLSNYFACQRLLLNYGSDIEKEPIKLRRIFIVLVLSAIAIYAIAHLLEHTWICNLIVYTVVACGFLYYLKISFTLHGIERSRMLVAFILILQGIIFFVLYNQMPTSLTFFTLHNVDRMIWGWHVPAAEYQVLNPIVIVIMSPILAWCYSVTTSTHVTKFCIGMSLCAAAFLVLGIPQLFSTSGIISSAWIVLTYFLQSVGELLISALGLSMVAELCPSGMSGFVMGIWFLTSMLAGPIGAYVGSFTTRDRLAANISALDSLHIYSQVFLTIGGITAGIAILMWSLRPKLIRILKQAR